MVTSVTVDPADQIDDQGAKAGGCLSGGQTDSEVNFSVHPSNKREMVMVRGDVFGLYISLNYIILCFTLYHGVFVMLPKRLGCSCWRCLGDLYDLLTPVENPAG